MRPKKQRRESAHKQYGWAQDRRSPDQALNSSEELFSQRYDDGRRPDRQEVAHLRPEGSQTTGPGGAPARAGSGTSFAPPHPFTTSRRQLPPIRAFFNRLAS